MSFRRSFCRYDIYGMLLNDLLKMHCQKEFIGIAAKSQIRSGCH